MHYLLLILSIAACTPKSGPQAPPTPSSEEPKVTEFIEETTMGSLGTVPVGMANAGKNFKYTLPNGKEVQGEACLLVLPDRQVWVGAGSEVQVEGATWRITKVEVPEDDNGTVYLELLSGPS